MERIKNFFNDESGASAVEYGLLVAVIAVGLIAVMGTSEGSVSSGPSAEQPPRLTRWWCWSVVDTSVYPWRC